MAGTSARPAYYRNVRSEVAAFLPSSYGTVLEIGCGEGVFAAAHYPDGVESWGVEPTDAATEAEGRFTHVLRGLYGDVESRLPDGHFDLVICNDVIEHVPDHDELLASVHRKLRPGGHLVSSVPNMRYVKALFELVVFRDWRYVDQGILDRTHLRFFTAKSLRRTLREHGFALEEFRGINSALTDIRGLKSLLKAAGCLALVVGTLGWQADIRFQQFALRAVRKD